MSGLEFTKRLYPRSPYDGGAETGPRFSLGNERTCLAWVRATLALLATGVALEVMGVPILPDVRVGAALLVVMLGALAALQIWSGRYRTEEALPNGRALPRSGAAPAMVVGDIVAMGVVTIGAVTRPSGLVHSGLQLERTLLVWHRACLSLAVGAAVGTRLVTDAQGAATHAAWVVGVDALPSYACAAALYCWGSTFMLLSGQLPWDGQAFAFAVVALLAAAVPCVAFVVRAGYASFNESVVGALDVWPGAEGTW